MSNLKHYRILLILVAFGLSACAANKTDEFGFYAYGKAPGEDPYLNRMVEGNDYVVLRSPHRYATEAEIARVSTTVNGRYSLSDQYRRERATSTTATSSAPTMNYETGPTTRDPALPQP